MNFLKKRRSWGMVVLAIWLILSGALQLGLNFSHAGYVMAALGIAAGHHRRRPVHVARKLAAHD